MRKLRDPSVSYHLPTQSVVFDWNKLDAPLLSPESTVSVHHPFIQITHCILYLCVGIPLLHLTSSCICLSTSERNLLFSAKIYLSCCSICLKSNESKHSEGYVELLSVRLGLNPDCADNNEDNELLIDKLIY